MSLISLANSSPEKFHNDVFKNRNSDQEMTLILPSDMSWKYYEPQSSLENGRYYWYGIPHPNFDTEIVHSSKESETMMEFSSVNVQESSKLSEIDKAPSSFIEHESHIEIGSFKDSITFASIDNEISAHREEATTEYKEIVTSLQSEGKIELRSHHLDCRGIHSFCGNIFRGYSFIT